MIKAIVWIVKPVIVTTVAVLPIPAFLNTRKLMYTTIAAR